MVERREMKNKRIKALETLRIKIDNLTYREVVEGCADDSIGQRLENKILDLVTEARNLREKK